MTITFYSNFLNDHQLPICLEFLKNVGEENFHFVADERIAPDRIAFGFEDMNEMYPFVVKAYEGGQSEELAKRLMIDSDVVIIGSSKNMPYKERINKGGLTFRYNERFLKSGDYRLFDLRLQLNMYKEFSCYRNKSLYMLCASAYTSRDLKLFGFPKEKCYKWGYFPFVYQYEDIGALLIKKNSYSNTKEVSLLWVGRFIDWKHPEIPIKIANKLVREGYKFKLNMIGIGPMKEQIHNLIKSYQLDNVIHLLGAMPPAEVRKEMEESEIFLFTSDKGEGWGAVLNESLNSACAVVANHSIGSVPFVLNHTVNGLEYKKNWKDAYKQVKILINSPDLRKKMGRAGYETISKTWNASNAVVRFICLCNNLKNGQETVYVDGPCSKA